MANISTFQGNVNILKGKFEIDFGSGWENHTKFLEYFNFFQELSEVSYGICKTEVFFSLKIINPDQKWTKKGLPVKYTISITDDKGLTYFDYLVFEGKTNKKSTISRSNIKISASDNLQNLLAKKPPARLLLEGNTRTVLNNLIANTLPSQVIEFSDILNYPITFVQSNDLTLEDQIIEFAKINQSLIIYEDGIIKFISGQSLGMLNAYPIIGDITLSKIKPEWYNSNIKLDKSEYFNVFEASGLKYTKVSTLFDGVFNSVKINPQETLFLDNLDINKIIPIDIYTVNMVFRVSDNETSPTINGTLMSSSIVTGEKILLKFKNNTSQPIYLKTLKINGLGLKVLSKISQIWKNTSQLLTDGEEIKFEIESKVAQWDGYLDSLIITQKNLTNNYFEFKAGWSPNFKVGKTITARTPQNVLIYGIITRVEAEHLRSLTATIRLRQYIPNSTTWFRLSSSPLSNSNFPLI